MINKRNFMKNIFKILVLSCTFFCLKNDVLGSEGYAHNYKSYKMWSDSDTEKLRRCMEEYGKNKHGPMSKYLRNEFPEYTIGQIRNKVHSLDFRKNDDNVRNSRWSDAQTETLKDFVERNKNHVNWKEAADLLDSKFTPEQCRKKYEYIVRSGPKVESYIDLNDKQRSLFKKEVQAMSEQLEKDPLDFSEEVWRDLARRYRGDERGTLMKSTWEHVINSFEWDDEKDKFLLRLYEQHKGNCHLISRHFGKRYGKKPSLIIQKIRYRLRDLLKLQNIHRNEIEEPIPDPVIISINGVPVDENLVPQDQ